MTRVMADGRMHVVRLVSACMFVLVAGAVLAGCARASMSADPAQTTPTALPRVTDASDIRLMQGSDFREWATKKSSLAEAEEFLKEKVRAPADTRGRKLMQIYTLETYSNGEPVERFDQAAILDYGDFTVGFVVCGSDDSAQAWVDGQVTALTEEVGLGRRTQVNGSPAAVRTKGTVPIKTDSEGRVLRPGVTYGGNIVSWAQGNVYISISSATVSSDELLLVAQSLDYK